MRLIFNTDENGLKELVNEDRIQPTDYYIPIEEKHKLMLEGKLLAEVEVDGQAVRWNPATEPDPRVKQNENGGKGTGGFRFSPYFHEKGIYLQKVIKSGIIKSIALAHSQIVGKYDKDAFKFDDPRLQELNGYLRAYLSSNFAHDAPRKITFMSQIVDIVMFLMKEDIYYRARFLNLFNELPTFELNQQEFENIERWH